MWKGWIKFNNKRLFMHLGYKPSANQLAECLMMNIRKITSATRLDHLGYVHQKNNWDPPYYRLVYYFYPHLKTTHLYAYLNGKNTDLRKDNITCSSFLTGPLKRNPRMFKLTVLRDRQVLLAAVHPDKSLLEEVSLYYKGFLFSTGPRVPDKEMRALLDKRYQEALIKRCNYKNVGSEDRLTGGISYKFVWAYNRAAYSFTSDNSTEAARMGDLIKLAVNPKIRDYKLNFPKETYPSPEIARVKRDLKKYEAEYFSHFYTQKRKCKSPHFNIYNESLRRKGKLKIKSWSNVSPSYR